MGSTPDYRVCYRGNVSHVRIHRVLRCKPVDREVGRFISPLDHLWSACVTLIDVPRSVRLMPYSKIALPITIPILYNRPIIRRANPVPVYLAPLAARRRYVERASGRSVVGYINDAVSIEICWMGMSPLTKSHHQLQLIPGCELWQDIPRFCVLAKDGYIGDTVTVVVADMAISPKLPHCTEVVCPVLLLFITHPPYGNGY